MYRLQNITAVYKCFSRDSFHLLLFREENITSLRRANESYTLHRDPRDIYARNGDCIFALQCSTNRRNASSQAMTLVATQNQKVTKGSRAT